MRLDQLEDGGQRALTGGRQVLQQALEELTEGLDLLLLALERHDLARAPGLQEEHPLARRADRPAVKASTSPRSKLGLVTVVPAGRGQDGRSSAREPPVELTVSTIGPFVP